MNILGINIKHDRGAAIVRDGQILAYVAEERLDRIKHSSAKHIPCLAIDYVLAATGLAIHEIDVVGVSTAGKSATLQETMYRELVTYGCRPDIEIDLVGHHYSHACAAYYCSPYSEAAIWIADGGGSFVPDKGQEAESYYLASGNTIQPIYTRYQPNIRAKDLRNLQEYGKTISLGRKYEQMTYALDFGFQEAGKTMGLAPYGRHTGRWTPPPAMAGRFEPDLVYEHLVASYLADCDRDMSEALRADGAAETQALLEAFGLQCIEQLHAETGAANLCLGGGVALNCVLNAKIARESPFASVFIFPAAGDEGQAIGNALQCYYARGGMARHPLRSAGLGRSYSRQETLDAVQAANLIYRCPDDVFAATAAALDHGMIVGWHQGGSECGPRALGFRSILADPRNPDIKDILNTRVKHREAFRPFAPAVLETAMHTYFDVPVSESVKFMLVTAVVLPHQRSRIPGVVHVDGSARLQSVSQTSNPYLAELLNAFAARTGIPVLVNTSFNVAGEPIVETPQDAIRSFLSTGIDYLVLGDIVVTKQDQVTHGT